MREIKDKDGNILHIIFFKEDFKDGRIGLINGNESLQCAAIKVKEGKSFDAHKHIFHNVDISLTKTQEAWIIISGAVEIYYYDMNDKLIDSQTLIAGDMSITLRGGHAYKIINDSLVYEFKTGPYLGVEYDKEYINR